MFELYKKIIHLQFLNYKNPLITAIQMMPDYKHKEPISEEQTKIDPAKKREYNQKYYKRHKDYLKEKYKEKCEKEQKMKISAVYKIINIITGDFYIGSSKDVKSRWAHHKVHSTWKKHPNNKLYQDMQKYGIDKFDFQILANVEPDQLKETEQQFIEKLHPTYNNYNAKGLDIERRIRTCRKYGQSEKCKEYQKEYRQSEKGKETRKKYEWFEKRKEYKRKYHNQLCSYNGEILTLSALSTRFYRAGIEHPTLEAKKYLLDK